MHSTLSHTKPLVQPGVAAVISLVKRLSALTQE